MDARQLFAEIVQRTTQISSDRQLIPDGFRVETSAGSTDRTSIDELAAARDLLGGELKSLTAYYRTDRDEFERDRLIVWVRQESDAEPRRCSFHLSGTEDSPTIQFSITLLAQLRDVATNLSERAKPMPQPAVADTAGAATPSPRSEAKRRRSIKDTKTLSYVRLPKYGLEQIEEELSELGEVGVSSEEFTGAESTGDLAGLDFRRMPKFSIYAPRNSRWNGVEVTFDDLGARVRCTGKNAWGAYCRVSSVLEAYQSRTLRWVRLGFGMAIVVTTSVNLGIAIGRDGRDGHSAGWLDPISATFAFAEYLSIIAWLVLWTTTRPRVTVGASAPSWFTRNRDPIIVGAIFLVITVAVSILLAVLNVRH